MRIRNIVFQATILVFIFASLASAQEDILISLQVLRVLSDISGDTSLEQDIFSGNVKPGDSLKLRELSYFTKANLKVGDSTLGIKDGAFFFNAEHDQRERDARSVEVVATPRIIVKDGQEAKLMISAPQNLEYFERRQDGLYELKKVEEPVGLEISLKAHVEGKSVRLSELTFDLRSVEKRIPLEGASLDVGVPVISARTFEANLRIDAQRDYGIMFKPDGQGVLLVLLRAELVQNPR